MNCHVVYIKYYENDYYVINYLYICIPNQPLTTTLNFNPKITSANNSGKRYVVHQGGTGSGKTFSILQYLLSYATEHKGCVISVVAESLPHLKRGALRDFRRILQMIEWDKYAAENKTEHTFKIEGSTIEFFSADAEAKLRGARRDILFINECNNIDYESFQQLDVRTRKQTILDFNPVCRFWVHDKLMPSLPAADLVFVKSSYLDNDFLGEEEKRNIERRRQNTSWWKVYGEGEIGMNEGMVFTNWEIVAPLPPEGGTQSPFRVPMAIGMGQTEKIETLPGSLIGYGIDFGFTHSPTAVIQVNEYNGELYVHELLYRSGMQNEELIEFAHKHLDLRALAVADSAEPKTIDYLYRKGWFGLKPAVKGNDSLLHGINLLLDRKINVTSTSVNVIKELRQYMWDTNKDGAYVRRPVKDSDHAIDALRYLYSYPRQRRLMFA